MSGALPAPTTANTRITIYVSAQLDEQIRRAAEEAGQSLSVWMVRAARAALARDLSISLEPRSHPVE
jgi:uncharacterized protein (DUF1778 family)